MDTPESIARSAEAESIRSRELAKAVLGYLLDHPEAQDTLEGIAGWWLLERYVTQQLPRVQRVVTELVAHGYLVVHQGADNRARYSINREQIDEIRKVLEQVHTAGRTLDG